MAAELVLAPVPTEENSPLLKLFILILVNAFRIKEKIESELNFVSKLATVKPDLFYLSVCFKHKPFV